nr:MAG TPA: hypothetical protein [Caudoviricetes sp.]
MRRQRETFTFDSEKALIDYVEELKENVSKLEVK